MAPEHVATPISGCVICYQEADRIADCVRSLSFCAEVVVVDSGSTDGTPQLAAQLGARVVDNAPFPGHREQKQFAVEQAKNRWVFCLDADERATPALQQRLRGLAAQGLQGAAYELPRINHYLGRIVRGGLFWPDRKVRLFDRQHVGEETSEQAERKLRPFIVALSRRGLAPGTRVSWGRRHGPGITAEAAARRHDLIFLGTKGPQSFLRWLRAGTVDYLVRKSPCDLMLFRPAAV